MGNGIENGVDIINDVSGLNFDKRSFDLINSKKNIKINFRLETFHTSCKILNN